MEKQNLQLNKPFTSYLMGGYECTYARSGTKRMDLLAATAHDRYCRDDYRLLKELRITSVREGLSWSRIDRGHGAYDFGRFEEMMKIARHEGIQQIWDLNHFDYPDYLDVFSDDFASAFASYAKEAVRTIRKYQSDTIYIVPLNEISYFAYKAADKGAWAPFCRNEGLRFKIQLVKACIAAMDAVWSADSDVRYIHVDPVFYRKIHEPVTPKKTELETWFNEIRFMTWDMIGGKVYPELGGNPKYLNIIGANYYIHNQEWIVGEEIIQRSSYRTIPFDHPDRISFAELLTEVHERYDRPVMVSETGWCGEDRVKWWPRTLREIDEAKIRGVDIQAVCIYPILDMFDWHDSHLTHPGIWDFDEKDATLARIPHLHSIRSIHEYFGL